MPLSGFSLRSGLPLAAGQISTQFHPFLLTDARSSSTAILEQPLGLTAMPPSPPPPPSLGNTIVCYEGSCAQNPQTFTKRGEYKYVAYSSFLLGLCQG